MAYKVCQQMSGSQQVQSLLRTGKWQPAAQRHNARHRALPVPMPAILQPPHLPEKGDPVWGNCALLVDKPFEWTSHDVCSKLKLLLNTKKIGHAGTLDLRATGLLIVCIGKGTKSSETLMAQHKVYTGLMKLGEATLSYDAELEPSEFQPWQHVTDAMLQAAANEHFTGSVMQEPPAFSAVKVQGQKMYNAARKGVKLDKPPRAIEVTKFRVWREDATSQLANYEIACSKGTYVRSLIHDLAQKVGTCAHVQALRRLRNGEHDVAAAWTMPALEEEAWRQGLPRFRHRHPRSDTELLDSNLVADLQLR